LACSYYFPDFDLWVIKVNAEKPSAAPVNWKRMKAGTDEISIPENESLKLRAIVTAGFAKDVDEVKK
jgi:hypothetical protein